MGAEYINPQWRLPNEKTGNNQDYSMSLSASNDYISIGSVPTLFIGSWSISFWFKAPSTGNTSGTIISRYRSANATGDLEISSSSGQIYVETGGGFPSTGTNMPVSNPPQIRSVATTLDDGNWHHIAFSLDYTSGTSTRSLYVDGSLDISDSTTTPAEWVSQTDNLLFGILIAPSNSPYNGFISEVAIFDYTLPSTGSNSVATLYNSGTPFNPMALAIPPQAYYPLGNAAHMGSDYLTPNGALQDYVFSGYPGGTKLINTNINKSNTGGKFTFSVWQKYNGSGFLTFNHGAGAVGEFRFFANAIVYLAPAYYQYFDFSPSTAASNLNWQHWVIFVDTTNVTNSKFWVDGVPISKLGAATGTSANTFTTGLQMNIGGYPLISNMMYFENYEIDQANVDKLYGYGSPLMSTATLTQAPNAWYKLDASEVYNSSIGEWSVDNNANTSTYDTSINLVRASSQKIDIANGSELDFTGDFTMSIWVNLTTSSNNMGVFNKTSQANSNGVSLFKRGGANFEFYVSEYSNVLTFASQGDNIWQQITITLNRTTGERIAYVNGEQAATLTHIKTFTFPNQGWDIGTFANNSPNYLDAKVSNFKLFNSVLSPTEVQTLYNNGTPLTDMSSFTSLQGWWKLNNLSSGLTDSSSNSNNATTWNSATKYAGFVNALAGESSGMNQTNLVQSDLLTTSSYSPYALNFDGNDHLTLGNNNYGFTSITSAGQTLDNLSISVWFKNSGGSGNQVLTTWWATGTQTYLDGFLQYNPNNRVVRFGDDWQTAYTFPSTPTGWTHMVGVKTTNNAYIYVNGNLVSTKGSTLSFGINRECRIGGNQGSGEYFVGGISNVSLWEYNLSASQIREIYNEGRPSNLHTFSGTAPVAWWQIGSNSSYASGWTCLNEVGSNDATSQGMLENAITDGVGTSGNGTSTNMGTANNISGSSPNGEGNSLSVNMTLANIAGGVN